MKQLRFPKGFLWGGATADFQYEGGFNEAFDVCCKHAKGESAEVCGGICLEDGCDAH